MKTYQLHYSDGNWNNLPNNQQCGPEDCELVLVLGSKALIKEVAATQYLASIYPNGKIVYASTAGEIAGDQVYDDTIVATGLHFEKTTTKTLLTAISSHQDSASAGAFIMESLAAQDCKSILILADGTLINGSELVAGCNSCNNYGIPLVGGLAGDGSLFTSTLTGLDTDVSEGNIIGIGFYGDALKVGFGSVGGWDEFGIEKIITKSHQNVLYEIDGRKALDLYKEYLGPYKDELPASSLLFPLSLIEEGNERHLVRTILGIDEATGAMTFAGNMPEGSTVRLMKGNFDRIIVASASAAQSAVDQNASENPPEFALLISCIGRKLVLQARIHEEIETAIETLGNSCSIAGFYSYGEISPSKPTVKCELYNQTMTITTFSEHE